jgi:hypothetical protein
MTDAHQEAEDAVWAARKSAAGFHAVGFQKGLDLAVEALRKHAKALRDSAKDAHDEGEDTRKKNLEEIRIGVLQIAAGLRKLKPGAQA